MLWMLLAAASWAASVCTVTSSNVDGHRLYRASIVETGARDTTEVECVGLPVWGTVVSYEATRTAGTGTTIRPVAGTTAAFVVSTQAHLFTAVSTAAHIHEQGSTVYYSPQGRLWVRNTPSSTATDHAITAEMLVVEGVH